MQQHAAVRSPRDVAGSDWAWYDVTLRMDGRKFGLPFGQGPAITGEPQAGDVVSLVVMGVRSVHHNGSLEEWADDWGQNPGDHGTQRMYRQWTRLSRRFRAFLGPELFSAYTDETQDDI